MTFPDFDKFQADLIEDVRNMATSKGKEYANSEDRFGNFNRLAQRLGIKREQVLLIYFTKHLDAIESFVKTGQTFSDEHIMGRIIDAITYLTLLGGMIHEDINLDHPTQPASLRDRR